MERENTEFLKAYLKKSLPVQWVNWWSSVKDPATKELLGVVLFEGDSLKDLTQPSVRQQVTDLVFHSEHLVTMILNEALPRIEELERSKKKAK